MLSTFYFCYVAAVEALGFPYWVPFAAFLVFNIAMAPVLWLFMKRLGIIDTSH